MPKLLPCLLLLAALSQPCVCASQPTKGPTPPDSSVCLSAATARRIDADLRKYPKVLKENKRLRSAVQTYENVVRQDAIALQAKDTVIAATERRVGGMQVLAKDNAARANRYKAKASKRGWVNVALSALLVAITVTAVSR